MEIFYIDNLSLLPKLEQNTCIIGTFDGVHIGHQELITKAKDFGLKTLLITFENRMKTNYYLTTTNQKYRLIKEYGADYLIVLPFEQIKNVLYTEFILLLKKLNVCNIICGADFKFGYKREGSIIELKTYFNIFVADYTLFNGTRISSSIIKEFITTGKLNKTKLFLGRNYSLIGKIRTLEFVDELTIIDFDYSLYLLPPNGIYSTQIIYCEVTYDCKAEIVNVHDEKKIFITVSKFMHDAFNDNIELIFLN